MTHYIVVTPSYTSYRGVWGDPPEPPEYGADVVVVDAPNKRAAKVIGVRKMRAERMEWVRDAASDNASPFTGLTVESAECDHGVCQCGVLCRFDWTDCPECVPVVEAEIAAEEARLASLSTPADETPKEPQP